MNTTGVNESEFLASENVERSVYLQPASSHKLLSISSSYLDGLRAPYCPRGGDARVRRDDG